MNRGENIAVCKSSLSDPNSGMGYVTQMAASPVFSIWVQSVA